MEIHSFLILGKVRMLGDLHFILRTVRGSGHFIGSFEDLGPLLCQDCVEGSRATNLANPTRSKANKTTRHILISMAPNCLCEAERNLHRQLRCIRRHRFRRGQNTEPSRTSESRAFPPCFHCSFSSVSSFISSTSICLQICFLILSSPVAPSKNPKCFGVDFEESQSELVTTYERRKSFSNPNSCKKLPFRARIWKHDQVENKSEYSLKTFPGSYFLFKARIF